MSPPSGPPLSLKLARVSDFYGSGPRGLGVSAAAFTSRVFKARAGLSFFAFPLGFLLRVSLRLDFLVSQSCSAMWSPVPAPGTSLLPPSPRRPCHHPPYCHGSGGAPPPRVFVLFLHSWLRG